MPRLTTEQTIRNWAKVEDALKRVKSKMDGGFSANDVLGCIMRDTMQVWTTNCGKGIAITEVQATPQYRTLHIVALAGVDAQDWLAQGMDQLDTFAKSQNCQYVTLEGRYGWKKLLKDFGFNESWIKLRKEV